MTEKIYDFDMAECLNSEENIREYFRQVMEDGDAEEIIIALGHIAKARGMTQLARDTGLGRESLYKSLAEGANPRFDTIMRVTKALGFTLTLAQS